MLQHHNKKTGQVQVTFTTHLQHFYNTFTIYCKNIMTVKTNTFTTLMFLLNKLNIK